MYSSANVRNNAAWSGVTVFVFLNDTLYQVANPASKKVCLISCVMLIKTKNKNDPLHRFYKNCMTA